MPGVLLSSLGFYSSRARRGELEVIIHLSSRPFKDLPARYAQEMEDCSNLHSLL